MFHVRATVLIFSIAGPGGVIFHAPKIARYSGMDHLWSPWRARHIARMSEDGSGPSEDQSLFERLASSGDDEANLILWRGDHVFVIMNLYPYNNGHLMIVPYRRVAGFEDLEAAEQFEISQTMAACTRWLRRALRPEGFNIGMNLGSAAGAGVPDHLHVHVVPRWSGDTNFMPAIAETKVLPEDIHTTFRRIRDVIEAEGDE